MLDLQIEQLKMTFKDYKNVAWCNKFRVHMLDVVIKFRVIKMFILLDIQIEMLYDIELLIWHVCAWIFIV